MSHDCAARPVNAVRRNGAVVEAEPGRATKRLRGSLFGKAPTHRELEVLRAVLLADTQSSAARELGVGRQTVKKTLLNLKERTGEPSLWRVLQSVGWLVLPPAGELRQRAELEDIRLRAAVLIGRLDALIAEADREP